MRNCLQTILLVAIALPAIGLISCDDPGHRTTCSDILPPHQVRISTARVDWHPAAYPATLEDDIRAGRILWHQPLPVPIAEVWDVDPKICRGMLSPLRMIFRPDTSLPAGASWAGITTYIGDIGIDSSRHFFRVRLLGTHGVLHIDFGLISEDLFGDGVNHDEDKDLNLIADPDEDIGLDLFPDFLEPGYDASLNPDPNGDNWYFEGEGKCPVPPSRCNSAAFQDSIHDPSSAICYEWINGTEGNLADIASLGLPDKLALGPNFNLANSYRSYQLDLASDSFLIRGSELNGWRTYSIPIRDSAAIDTLVEADGPVPEWFGVTHMRVWFESHGSSVPDTLQIADWWFEK